MRNVSNKSCKENQNSHFTFSNFFRKPCFHELKSKKWWRQKGRKRQNDGALHVGSVRPHARKHTPASCTHTQTHLHTRKSNHPRARGHAHKHTHTHTHTHTETFNIYRFSTATVVRERASNVTLYIYCLSSLLSKRKLTNMRLLGSPCITV